MSQDLLPATLTSAGTFAFSTTLQHVDPTTAAFGAIVAFVLYLLSCYYMDELIS
jgi:hypothetical protein